MATLTPGNRPCAMETLKSAETDGAMSSANVRSIQTEISSGPYGIRCPIHSLEMGEKLLIKLPTACGSW